MSYDRRAFDHKTPEELQADIAQTRARISQDVDALGYRLSPAGLSEDAKNTLLDTQGATFKAIEGVKQGITARSDGLGDGVAALVRKNPVPATLLGFGLAWLLMRSDRSRGVKMR